jgi:hypothetical protein
MEILTTMNDIPAAVLLAIGTVGSMALLAWTIRRAGGGTRRIDQVRIARRVLLWAAVLVVAITVAIVLSLP